MQTPPRNRCFAHKRASVMESVLPGRGGLTVLELLAAMAIIGVLAGLLLPVIGAAREAARRIQCVEHLREVGSALHNHHNSVGSLPSGWAFDPSQASAFGWSVPILPFLGQSTLADRIDCKKPLNDVRHSEARKTSLAVLLCPSDIAEPRFMLFDAHDDHNGGMPNSDANGISTAAAELLELPTANYIGVFGTLEPDDEIPAPIGDGAFLENRISRFRDFQRGLSQTVVVGERTMAQVPSTWVGVDLAGEDAAARLVGAALEGINNSLADECDFSSRHPGGANFLWGDGHVSFMAEDIDLLLYHESARLRQ